MKKEEKTKEQKPTALESTYFRLCHFCFHLNEADQPILDCSQCSNLLSSEPIEEFYEDVYQSINQRAPSQPDDEEDESPLRAVPPNPILRGLSVVW